MIFPPTLNFCIKTPIGKVQEKRNPAAILGLSIKTPIGKVQGY